MNEIRSLRQAARVTDCKAIQPDKEIAKSDPDYTLGIYQSIGKESQPFVLDNIKEIQTGYKEFNEYLSNPGKQSDKTFQNAVERMKISTRQYARRQISWIRNKFLPLVYTANAEGNIAPTYLLDASGEQNTDVL